MSKKEKEIVAFHESGHAIVASSYRTRIPFVESRSSREDLRIGYTLQLPTEDRYLMTKTELLDRLAVLLGEGWLRKSFLEKSPPAPITIFRGRPTLRPAW